MNTKISTYINFAVRAKKVIFGLDLIKNSKQTPYVIIYDNTLGSNSKSKMIKYAQDNNIDILEVPENYLNEILKRSNVKLIGLLDESLSNAIKNNWQEK